MVYSRYAPLIARLRQVANNPPELPVPWSTRSRSTFDLQDTTPTEGAYARSPLYRAERRMNLKILQPWILYGIEDVQAYTSAVLQRCAQQYSRAEFPVRVQQGPTGTASYLGGTITLPLPVRQTTILHELAHHLTATTGDHGQDFRDAYVALLTQEMSVDTAQKLLVNLQ